MCWNWRKKNGWKKRQKSHSFTTLSFRLNLLIVSWKPITFVKFNDIHMKTPMSTDNKKNKRHIFHLAPALRSNIFSVPLCFSFWINDILAFVVHDVLLSFVYVWLFRIFTHIYRWLWHLYDSFLFISIYMKTFTFSCMNSLKLKQKKKHTIRAHFFPI